MRLVSHYTCVQFLSMEMQALRLAKRGYEFWWSGLESYLDVGLATGG